MTKSDFISKNLVATRAFKRMFFLWMGGFLAFGLANLPIGCTLETYLKAHPDYEQWVALSYLLTFFGFLIASFALCLFYSKRLVVKYGLVCPNCGGRLTGALANIAIATSRCGHCGLQILDTEP